MNQTEAWETVIFAAQTLKRGTFKVLVCPHEGRAHRFVSPISNAQAKKLCASPGHPEPRDLETALRKVIPKIQRMRQRLDAQRNRRTKPEGMPDWLDRATR